tara:strand:- start:30238 stop:30456 length:219 start_codon:yes stop_codon:yes gene_type:complete
MKYLEGKSIDIESLKHDILGLVGPLEYSRELSESDEQELSSKIHKQAIAKIEMIAKELESIQQKVSGNEVSK